MTIILISGIVLVAAAVGLLGFVIMQNKKSAKKDEESDSEETSEKKTDEADDEDSKDNTTTSSADMGIATKSFLILSTLTFFTLFLGASYWAYTSEPLYGLMVACAAILIYAILVILQEILKNLISLNQQPVASEEEE